MRLLVTHCLTLLAALAAFTARAQGVLVGPTGPAAASAALEVRSTSQSLLLPRLTALQRAGIASPVAGLLIFQTDNTPGVYYYDGAAWLNLTTGSVAPVAGVVSKLAGSTVGYAEGTGAAARFFNPFGVACDGSGNVYVADRNNNRIRRIVAATGEVSTLAGSTVGYAEGTGAAAQFNSPFGVACDGSGNVYVADLSNHRIRRIVAATGAVSTVAGSGTAGYADGVGPATQFNNPIGVACDGSGAVYVADRDNHRIRVIR